MKIQLSEKRIVPNVLTVWSHPGPEVDIVMDLKNLTFRAGSIEEMYVFHVLDHLFPEEGALAIENWFQCLAQTSSMHVLNDNFEYLARAFIGGDISIELYNEIHNHPCQCTEKSTVDALKRGGFKDDSIVIWYGGNPEYMEKKHYEFILTAKKS